MHRLDIEKKGTQNGIKTTKVKKKHWHQLLTQCIYDFAENTTLNGLKYIADGSSYIEKLFWASTFTLSAVLCFIMVYKTYVKWDTSAVIITLKEHLVSVHELPFPAVTICPLVRINRYDFKDAYRLHKKGVTFRGRDSIRFYTALMLCQKNITTNFTNFKYPATFLVESHWLAPHYDDVFESCKFRGADCTYNFRKVLTADGMCYTFNSLASKDIFRNKTVSYQFRQYYLNTTLPQQNWSLDTNTYTSPFFYSVYPRRGRVYLHHPGDLPQASLHYYMASQEHTTSFALKLDILGTSDDIVKYHPDVRQCYFPSERRLTYFEKYSQKNCQLECLTNYTSRICKCVNFYMPRNQKTPICNSNQINCTSRTLDRYVSNKFNAEKCRCLPSCHDIQYNADIIVTKFDQDEYNAMFEELKYIENGEDDGEDSDDVDDDNDDDSYDDGDDNNGLNDTVHYNDTDNDSDSSDDEKNITTNYNDDDFDSDDTYDDGVMDNRKTEIRIYYRQSHFVAMERSELFGLSQFLADCGGTLGLFLGFSFLTIAEIIYFFTLKLFCHVRSEKKTGIMEKKSDREITKL